MPYVQSDEQCVICLGHESVMHSHHTIPRSRGGDASRQIILCSNCHNILHANAVYLVSKLRNPKKPSKSFWKNEDCARRADVWLRILVTALQTPVNTPDSVEHLVGAKLRGDDFQRFKLLASNLGCSQEKAVEFCIKFTLQAKGVKHDQTKTKLWFLPVS